MRFQCCCACHAWADNSQGMNPDRGGCPFENRSDNKLARVSVVMLHVQPVVIIFSARLNGAVTSQKAL